jgi:hypothetical protein
MATRSNEAAARSSVEFDRLVAQDVQKGYDEALTKSSAEPIRILQRMAKLFLNKWDRRKSGGETRKDRNALRQLIDVPLTFENRTWFFESSFRDAFRYAIYEEARGDPLNPDRHSNDEGYSRKKYNQWLENQEVRAAFLAGIRTDANPADVQRVLKAIETVGGDEDEDESGDN